MPKMLLSWVRSQYPPTDTVESEGQQVKQGEGTEAMLRTEKKIKETSEVDPECLSRIRIFLSRVKKIPDPDPYQRI
jgi:hypothetical protein